MIPNSPKYIIVHHAGGTESDPLFDTSNQAFSVIDAYHKQRWQATTKSELGYYCGYHYFIDKYGVVTQARRDLEGGAHTIGMNYSSIGICLAGNFDTTLPTDAQKAALTSLIENLQSRYLIPASRVVPHRAFASKSCYGNRLGSFWASVLVEEYLIPDAPIREFIKKLFHMKLISSPKLSLLFGGMKEGPLSHYEAC